MFYIRIDNNNKHDTLKQLSLCGILNTLCRPQHPGLGMPLITEQDTSYVCMNQFVASMEVYPHTKYSISQPYSFFRYCAYQFHILWACLGMPYKYIYYIILYIYNIKYTYYIYIYIYINNSRRHFFKISDFESYESQLKILKI